MSYNTDVATAPQSVTITANGSQTFTMVAATVKAGMYTLLTTTRVTSTNALSTVTISASWTQGGTVWTEPVSTTLALVTSGRAFSKVFAMNPDVGTAITLTATYTGLGGSFAIDASVRPPR